MIIEIDIPEKVAKNIDDVLVHVKKQNPGRDNITIEEVLKQTCIEYLIIEYANYQRVPEEDESEAVEE